MTIATGEQAVFQYLRAKGLSPTAAAGVTGNLMQESGLNPAALNEGEGAYGLAQWRLDRRGALNAFAGERASHPQAQLDFLLHEAGQMPGFMDRLNAAKTPADAAMVFAREYERPKTIEPARLENAQAVLMGASGDDKLTSTGVHRIGGGQAPAPTAVPSSIGQPSGSVVRLGGAGPSSSPQPDAQPGGAQSAAPEPTLLNNPYTRAGVRFLKGGVDAGLGVLQAGVNMYDAPSKGIRAITGLDMPLASDKLNAGINDYNDKYNAWRQAYGAKPGEIDWAALAGQAAPYMAIPANGVVSAVAGGAMSGLTAPQTEGRWDPIKALIDAAIGGATAGAVYGGLSKIAQAFRWGQSEITGAYDMIRAHVKRAGKDFPDSVAAAREALNANPDLLLAEVGGNTKIPQKIATLPGEGREIAEGALYPRSADAGPRVDRAAEQTFTRGQHVDELEFDALAKQSMQRAGPLYDEAYRSNFVMTDRIKELIQRPSMREALKRAKRIAAEEGRDPMQLGLIDDDAGNIVNIKSPSVQTMDYVKRGLDDVLNQFRNPITGKLVLDESGRAINNTLAEFRSIMREQVPEYGAALDAYADPARLLEAKTLGLKFLNLRPNDLRRMWARFKTPEEHVAFRVGAVQAIEDQTARVPTGNLVTRGKLSNTRALEQKLNIIAGEGDDPAALMNRLVAERRMQQNQNAILSGSQTAERMASLGDDETAKGAALAGQLASAAAGNPWASMSLAAKAWELLRRPGREAERNMAARVLFSTNPVEKTRALDMLLRNDLPRPDYTRVTVPAGVTTGASISALVSQDR